MLRFASAIRFVSKPEWDQFNRDKYHSVLSWDMNVVDQWVPAEQAETEHMAPCIAGGLTRIKYQENETRGRVALCHLIPAYHGLQARWPLMARIRQSAQDLRTPDQTDAPLQGCFVGGYTKTSAHHLWPTICQGVSRALGDHRWGIWARNLLAQTGWLRPTLPKSVSAFVGQQYGALSSMAYDGTKDTWIIWSAFPHSEEGVWPPIKTAQDIRDLFQFRQVGTHDQVFIGLNSTEPIDKAVLDGVGP